VVFLVGFDFTVEERAFRPASEVRDESGFTPGGSYQGTASAV